MNIVVLAGGTSTERDVSIMTSMMVCGSLRRNGHHANMIDVFTGSGKYKHSSEFFQEDNDLKKLADSMKEQSAGIAKLVEERERIGGGFFGPGVLELCQAADIVYIGLHGANGEDGKIQAAFDLMGIKYTGTGYLSSAISMSKDGCILKNNWKKRFYALYSNGSYVLRYFDSFSRGCVYACGPPQSHRKMPESFPLSDLPD